jgi:L-idonate 5-dehydrogenase
MKACVLHGPKDLRLEDIPLPEPTAGHVRLRMGGVGICGSDLHYYHHGRVGNAVVCEPMILGHELSGAVDKVGPGVTGLDPGQKVIVNPTDECGTCAYCRAGRQNLCPSLRYFGSAARTPHVQGIMVEYPLVQARQIVPVSDDMPLDQAACVEPLAIALHAVSRAGNLLGKRVFISGAGPVGCLIAAVARLNGASEVVISDMESFPLGVATRLGADRTVKADKPEDMADLENACQVSFEASGAIGGMQTCLRNVAPGGTVVHVGFLSSEEVAYPINTMVIRKEATVCGSLRAYQEFPLAARLVETGRLDLTPLITATYPLDKAEEAILVASDKTRSMKVVLTGK